MLSTVLTDLKNTSTQLVVVSKTRSLEAIQEIYRQGPRAFGENRVPELVDKQAQLPKDIEWHFIGHLQTKKVKHIAPFVHLIHSVDSDRVLVEINKQAKRNERCIDVLLQFKIAQEESKYGFDWKSVDAFLASDQFQQLENIRVVGVMGMATFTDNMDQVQNEFKKLKEIFNQLQSSHFDGVHSFKEISMGMSGDYKIAIKEGSTMVRIGSLLF